MKCPERYSAIQQNIRRPILDDDRIVKGEYHILIENQGFSEICMNFIYIFMNRLL